jgi:hypothetical protein
MAGIVKQASMSDVAIAKMDDRAGIGMKDESRVWRIVLNVSPDSDISNNEQRQHQQWRGRK